MLNNRMAVLHDRSDKACLLLSIGCLPVLKTLGALARAKTIPSRIYSHLKYYLLIGTKVTKTKMVHFIRFGIDKKIQIKSINSKVLKWLSVKTITNTIEAHLNQYESYNQDSNTPFSGSLCKNSVIINWNKLYYKNKCF